MGFTCTEQTYRHVAITMHNGTAYYAGHILPVCQSLRRSGKNPDLSRNTHILHPPTSHRYHVATPTARSRLPRDHAPPNCCYVAARLGEGMAIASGCSTLTGVEDMEGWVGGARGEAEGRGRLEGRRGRPDDEAAAGKLRSSLPVVSTTTSTSSSSGMSGESGECCWLKERRASGRGLSMSISWVESVSQVERWDPRRDEPSS